MTDIKEHPILFSGDMVRAILRDPNPKTMTRRVLRDQHPIDLGASKHGAHLSRCPVRSKGKIVAHQFVPVTCPYGQPGDRLWVREAWGVSPIYDSVSPRDLKPRDMKVNFAADDALRGCKVRSSIHMPRWASRILLEIVSVRVERLQDISEADAQAEGAPFELGELERVMLGSKFSYRNGFCRIWKTINGSDSWDANPWVWVVEFKRVESGND